MAISSKTFLADSSSVKRILDYIGMPSSDTHAGIPNNVMPVYSPGGVPEDAHGGHGLYKIQDGMSLLEAIYTLDVGEELDFQDIKFEGSSPYAEVTIDFTRTLPVFVAAKVERIYIPTYDVSESGTLAGWTNNMIMFDVVVENADYTEEDEHSVYTIYGMETDGCISGMFTFTPTEGENTLKLVFKNALAEPYPNLGTVLRSQIVVMGIKPF